MKQKEIQLTVNIGEHDLERKAKQAAKFREKGHGVNIKLRLRRGREAGRTNDAQSVVDKFLSIAEVPDNKTNRMTWNSTTLSTYIHP